MALVDAAADQSRPSDDPAIVRRTQVYDIARSIPSGMLVPLETSVLLTIAITQFDAAGWVKGLIAAASGVGLLLSPVITEAVRRSQRRAMRVAAIISCIGAAGFALAAFGSIGLLVLGSIVGVAAITASIPLLTATYEDNFPAFDRGKRVGRGMAVRVGVGALTGLLMGRYLRAHPERWWQLVLVGTVAMLLMAWTQRQLPSRSIPPVDGRHPSAMPHFHLLREDRQLRLTLIAWMFMGFGNLMLLPLRVEFLANPTYGVNADAAKIVMLTVTLPSVVRLACMPVFGRLFDRMSFFSARIMVNLLFAIYVAAFFSGTGNTGLILGAIAFGVGSAGGDLMWTLWVTKFAPPGRVADYMGLHTFFTGTRAASAPLLGFFVIERFNLTTVAIIAALLIVISSLMLLPEARLERASRPSARRGRTIR
jgi:MFS family permease